MTEESWLSEGEDDRGQVIRVIFVAYRCKGIGGIVDELPDLQS